MPVAALAPSASNRRRTIAPSASAFFTALITRLSDSIDTNDCEGGSNFSEMSSTTLTGSSGLLKFIPTRIDFCARGAVAHEREREVSGLRERIQQIDHALGPLEPANIDDQLSVGEIELLARLRSIARMK